MTQAGKAYGNVFFRTKLLFLLILGINAAVYQIVFYPRMAQWDARRQNASGRTGLRRAVARRLDRRDHLRPDDGVPVLRFAKGIHDVVARFSSGLVLEHQNDRLHPGQQFRDACRSVRSSGGAHGTAGGDPGAEPAAGRRQHDGLVAPCRSSDSSDRGPRRRSRW